MRIAALQLAYRPGETRAARTERVVELLSAAPEADLHVLPELWDVCYFAFDRFEDEARPLDDALDPIRDAVRRLGTVTVAGSVLERDGTNLYNTCAVLDGDGRILGTYRKKHLFAYGSREAELLTPGTDPGVVRTSLGVLGVTTCFDLRFADQYAGLRRDGVDLFVVPAAWPSPRVEHWDVLVRARAIENQTPIVACNGTGICEGVELGGRSTIVDARGNITARLGTEEAWMQAVLSFEDTRSWREEFPIETETAVALS